MRRYKEKKESIPQFFFLLLLLVGMMFHHPIEALWSNFIHITLFFFFSSSPLPPPLMLYKTHLISEAWYDDAITHFSKKNFLTHPLALPAQHSHPKKKKKKEKKKRTTLLKNVEFTRICSLRARRRHILRDAFSHLLIASASHHHLFSSSSFFFSSSSKAKHRTELRASEL